MHRIFGVSKRRQSALESCAVTKVHGQLYRRTHIAGVYAASFARPVSPQKRSALQDASCNEASSTEEHSYGVLQCLMLHTTQAVTIAQRNQVQTCPLDSHISVILPKLHLHLHLQLQLHLQLHLHQPFAVRWHTSICVCEFMADNSELPRLACLQSSC